MLENRTMCEDLVAAKTNRERVKQGYCNAFYAQQAHAVAQWQLGERPPESVILGSLPDVSKGIRLDKEEN